MSQPDAAGCHAVVLAAGASTRFDGAKLLAPVRGRPLICSPVAAALASSVEAVTVVLGSRGGEVAAALEPLANHRLSLVHCEDWQDGLSASLRCGIAALPHNARAAVIYLGDMPRLDPALADRVLAEVLAGAPAAFPVLGTTPGHPVALASDMFAKIGKLNGDQGARRLIKRHSDAVRVVTDDKGCVIDIDTTDDLANMALDEK